MEVESSGLTGLFGRGRDVLITHVAVEPHQLRWWRWSVYGSDGQEVRNHEGSMHCAYM